MTTHASLSRAVAAKRLSALGSERRIEVFQLLVRAGGGGLSVSEIQSHIAIPMTTLTHHVAALADSGLVKQTRTGREVICVADFEAIRSVSAFLLDDCCAGVARTGCAPLEAAA